jgi:hypothetical protein
MASGGVEYRVLVTDFNIIKFNHNYYEISKYF